MKDAELERIGVNLIELMQLRRFSEVGEMHEYALRNGRAINEAIKIDFEKCESECAGKVSEAKTEVKLTHFEENELEFAAVIECDFQMQRSSGILVELIVLRNDTIYLEDISSYHGVPDA